MSDKEADMEKDAPEPATGDSSGIDPAGFELNENLQYANQVAPAARNSPPLWIWLSLAALLILALFVIFVLPTVVSEYELPLERRLEVAEAQPVVVEPETTISPFEEAQRALQRKEAQDVLAELLGYQGELDALEVNDWGKADYEAALEQASIGDEYYRTQDFVLAAESYSQGRDGLLELLGAVPTVLEQTLIEGQRALDEADATTAQDKFSLALLFEPENEAAQIGLERSRARDQVTELFDQADDYFEDGELEAARDIYREIVSLDSYNDLARQRIEEVSARITENEFSRIMSEGYVLLENGSPEQAIAAFQRAGSLGINQDQAEAAILQTENEVANAQITLIREAITSAINAEQWQSAVDEYDKVLAIDSNLTFAITGRDYANKRAQLDRLLVNAIDNPERFSEDDVFEQTRDVYFTGRAIDEPGPLLLAQLDELQELLENSQVPVPIQLVSDNLTDVTLLRIANLGSFEQHSMSLKPGRYVAVGRRGGYREVREEFTVGFGQTPDAIVVQCDERIGAATINR